MSDRYYPIFVKGRNLHGLVAGGGTVGVRKAEALLASGARVTVVSPQGTDRLIDLSERNLLQWVREPYNDGFLQGVRLAIGATGDRSVNERVYRDACRRGIPVNIVDDPELCTFIVPAVVTKGPLCVAVCTGGAAPALARKIRDDLEAALPDEYEAMIDELGLLRPAIRRLTAGSKERFWQTIASIDPNDYRGEPEALRRHIRAELERAA
jgi:precorrin-2 dehydrogenase/sirohydrochlorin ferrochelatase